MEHFTFISFVSPFLLPTFYIATTFLNIVWSIFLLCAVIQCLYYGFIFSRFAFFKEPQRNLSAEVFPVSVIICAYNEAANLLTHLPSVLEQDYPCYEVIVVNDASTDDTVKILSYFQKRYKDKLRVVDTCSLKRDMAGKKFALTQGVKAARYQHLLLTDADCYPLTRQWIRQMVAVFDARTKVVLGYGPYEKKDGWLNMVIQYETVYTAIQYFSFALIGMPYMGVGRNLAYHKSLFEKEGGFQAHAQVTSGDDDLFINKVSTFQNTSITIHPASFCISHPATTWSDWYWQKKRHVSTGKYYQFKHQFMLGMLSLSHFFFYGMLIALIFNESYVCFSLIIYLLRLLIVTIVFYKVLHLLNRTYLLYLLPLVDSLFIIYYILFFPHLLNKSVTWNKKHL